MSPMPRRQHCDRCRNMTGTLTNRGLGHWLAQMGPDLHYMRTIAASALLELHWNMMAHERVAVLFTQLDQIDQAGQVGWIDVDDAGHFVVFEAAHGVVPRGI